MGLRAAGYQNRVGGADLLLERQQEPTVVAPAEGAIYQQDKRSRPSSSSGLRDPIPLPSIPPILTTEYS